MAILTAEQVLIKKTKKQDRNRFRKSKLKSIFQNYELYLFLVPAVVYFIVFKYVPMYGVQIAFKKFIPTLGIWGSEWVGFEHFERFFNSYFVWDLIKNTIGISVYSIVIGFPIPIIFALLLHEVKNKHYKKFVQTITYAPHFISTIVIVGMILAFLSPSSGIVNNVIKLFGGDPIPFMQKESMFKSIYVISDVWQHMGWSSIIYLAALGGVDVAIHEAAMIDGASKWKRIIHINIPSIMPTIVIMFIMRIGQIMSVGFEKILLMQNDLNIAASDIISTYVYRAGLENAQYSFSTAIGLFNAVINFVFLITVNSICKKLGDTSLW